MVKRLAGPPERTTRTFPTESERQHLGSFFHDNKDSQANHIVDEHKANVSKSAVKKTHLADRANFHRELHLGLPKGISEMEKGK